MDTTENKSGQYIKIYTPAEIEQLKELLTTSLGIKRIVDTPRMPFRMLRLQYNKKRRYDIKIAAGISPIPKVKYNKRSNCSYKFGYSGPIFTIEASVFTYSPNEIVEAIQEIENSFNRFKPFFHTIKKFTRDNADEAGDEVIDYFMYPNEIAKILAKMYITDNNIKDNKYNSNFITLMYMIEKELHIFANEDV